MILLKLGLLSLRRTIIIRFMVDIFNSGNEINRTDNADSFSIRDLDKKMKMIGHTDITEQYHILDSERIGQLF